MRDLERYLEDQYGSEPEFCGTYPCGCAWNCLVDVPWDNYLYASDLDPLDLALFELDRIEATS